MSGPLHIRTAAALAFLSPQPPEADTHAHIAPEPIEAPEPRPVERQRDLVRRNAIAWGWSVMTAQGSPPSVASFAAGVEAFEMYRAAHDRRAR